MPQTMLHASVQCASARSGNGAPVQGDVRPEPAVASNVLSPRTVLVHCAIAMSENEAPIQGNVWLALQPLLRTPVLCVKPLNGPTETLFLKTFETLERDASGCGWRLDFKTKVHCKEGAFMSKLIRLFPTTPQTSDQQLDDVIAAIRGFATQVLAKADFQHLMASPDEMSRLALPTFPTQSSVQPPVLAVCSPLPVCTQESTVPQTQYFAVPDDELLPVCPLWQLNNPECVASRITVRDWRVLKSAWYSWLYFHQDLQQWHSTDTVIEDTSEPDCDLPRASTHDFQYESTSSCFDDSFSEGEYESYDVSEMHSSEDDETEDFSADSEFNALDSEGDLFRLSTQDLRSTRELRVLAQAWAHWLQFVEKRRCYSDSFSDDSFDSEYEDFIEWPCLLARVPASDLLPTRGAQKPWRSSCVITLDEADTDGTWELPSLTAADCDGELELIRYTTCSSAIAFEDNAAAAISWERSASLGGRLDRALFASQLASVKDYWEFRQGLLHRRHTMRAPPAKFSTKRGRRLHRQELRRARAHRKSHRTDIPRPAQPAAQLRSLFPFAPPTAPTIPLTAPRGVFMFGATVMSLGIDSSPALSSATLSPAPLSSATSSESSFSSSLLLNSPRSMARQTQRMRALQESANLSTDPRSHGCATCDRPQVTTQSDQSKHYVARCKLDGCGASLGLLQPGILLCPMDDSSVEDSEQASAASTVPLLITILSLLHGFRPALPRYRRRKARDCKGNWQLSQPSTADTDFGKRLWQPRAHFSRCTRAHLKALGRSRWLNGLCRCLHSGCTNGTGPRPSIEP